MNQHAQMPIISYGLGMGLGAALLLAGNGLGAPEPTPLQIDTGWVMMTGDDAGWASPELDDAHWHTTRVDRAWEEVGFPGYDGYAWYRVRFVIPDAWRLHERVRAPGGHLVLSLGPVDDVDVTFCNGVKVGQTGRLPPDYVTAYDQERTYPIPADTIRWGQTNTLAVRVYDQEEPGGIYRGPVTIRPPTLGDFLTLDLRPDPSDGVYPSPGPMVLPCRISNRDDRAIEVALVAVFKSDHIADTRILEQVQANLKLPAQTSTTTNLVFHPPAPGFYQVACVLTQEEMPVVSHSMMLGYRPEELSPVLTREPDFEAFWRLRKQELAAVDPEFTLTRSDLSTQALDVYLVEMRSYGKVRIRGWYSVPRTPGPHPAILHLPGYGGSMSPVLDRTEVASLALNPRGHGNSKDDLDPQGREYMYLGFDPERPENYVYVGAFLDCVRAVDFLVSRPEIDGSRIGVAGGSQGGGLTFASAALDSRIACCAPDIPWLGDWIGYLACAPWPAEQYPELLNSRPGLRIDTVHRVLSYIDTMNLADRIRCPVLMSVGLQDDVCPPRTAFATYNQVRSEKSYRVYPLATHQVPDEHDAVKRQWMNDHLGIQP